MRKTESREVLVTGMPHFVASLVCRKILSNEPNSNITLLARTDQIEACTLILASQFPNDPRIKFAIGDVVLPEFGLSLADRVRILGSVTDVYHFAGVYHLGEDKAHIEQVNLGGTRNLLEFCAGARNLRRINHYSTVFVSGSRCGVVLEDELDMGQDFRNTYERTKFNAELEVRRAMRKFPISIYRPGLVMGTSDTGEIDRVDGPYLFVHLLASAPDRLPKISAAALQNPLQAVPADYVASAIYQLSLDSRAEGKCFHLVDSNPLRVDDGLRLLAEFSRLSGLGGNETNRTFGRKTLLERFLPGKNPYLHELESFAMYNASEAYRLLAPLGILCPPFSDYAQRLVEFVKRQPRVKTLH